MAKVVTIGESMVVFTPEGYGALRYESMYRARLAGAESNTAVGLAKLGIPSVWMSRVGDDEFGAYVLNQIRAEGVDTSHAVTDPGHRTGIMFKQREYGGETTAFYYRENSAASHLSPDNITEALIEGADYLHITGITPVLSDSCREAVRKAVDLAHRKGVKFSFDPNVRKKLIRGEADITELKALTLGADVVMLGLDEADDLFGIREVDQVYDLLYTEGNAAYVAVKDGGRGAWVSSKQERLHIPPYPCKPLENVGAGDGFNAGFLAGLAEDKPLETCGRMGAICGALATQSVGDMEGYPSRARLERILQGQQEIFR